MKKIYLLPLLLLLANPVFSQKKAEFGVVLSAGNFTRPNQQTTNEFHGDQWIYRTKNSQDAGSAFAVGVKQTLRLSGHFKLSGEFLYRMAAFRSSFSTSNSIIGADATAKSAVQNQQVRESSIAIPIKLHFSLKKNGRTSVALGAGLSHRMNAELKGWFESKSEVSDFMNYRYQYPDLDLGFRGFSSNLLFSAGVYHKLDNNTALGLEYNYERRSDEARYYSGSFQINDQLIECLCYGFVYLKTPNLRSFSLSLSHTLSR